MERVTVLVMVFSMTASAWAYSTGDTYRMQCGSETCGDQIRTGRLTYLYSGTRRGGKCQYNTPGCTVSSVYEFFDWHCNTCSYGGGAHGIEDLVRRYHTVSSCPGGDVSINAIQEGDAALSRSWIKGLNH